MGVSGNTPMPLTNTAAQNAKPREKAYKLPGVRIWDMKACRPPMPVTAR
jgi:hypothetical protein